MLEFVSIAKTSDIKVMTDAEVDLMWFKMTTAGPEPSAGELWAPAGEEGGLKAQTFQRLRSMRSARLAAPANASSVSICT